jgi:hypothetical protein
LVCIGLLIYFIYQEFKKRNKRRFIQLKKEQEYPIVFTREELTKKVISKSRFSASMLSNNFTNIRTGKNINTNEYSGFIIFGNTDELNLYHCNHGDLIFVKNSFTEKDIIGEFVVINKNGDYILKKVKSIKKNKEILLENKEKIDLINIIGPVEFNFNIKL